MDKAYLNCPGCWRRIIIPLRTVYNLSPIPIEDDAPYLGKELQLNDILWINDELSKMVQKQKKYIEKLEMLLDK